MNGVQSGYCKGAERIEKRTDVKLELSRWTN